MLYKYEQNSSLENISIDYLFFKKNQAFKRIIEKINSENQKIQ